MRIKSQLEEFIDELDRIAIKLFKKDSFECSEEELEAVMAEYDKDNG